MASNIEVVVGQQGTQNFPVTNKFASRTHCRITYDAANRMFTVEDLDSANGTYIIDDNRGFENVKFYRVTKVTVPHGTWLNLGGTEVGQGQRVLVDRVLMDDGNDYSPEFRLYTRKLAEYHAEEEALEQRAKTAQRKFTFLKLGMSVLFMGLIVILQSVVPWLNRPGVTMFASMGAMTFCSFFNWDGAKKAAKALKKNSQLYFLCPKCGKPLSEFSINQQACINCKAQ